MLSIHWRNLTNSGKYAVITVWSVLISAIIIISLEGLLAGMTIKDKCYHNDELNIEDEKNITPLPLYLFIFISSQLFQIYVTYDALYHNNNIEIVGSAIYYVCNSLYSFIQAYQLYKYFSEDCYNRIKIYTYIIPICCLLFSLTHIYLTFKLCGEFGWTIYKSIGADPKLRKIFKIYEIFITLVKYDFFFFVSYSLQMIFLILRNNDPEKWITVGLIFLSLIILFLSIRYIKEERKFITKFILVCFIMEICYFTFKLVRMYTVKKANYAGSIIFMTFFAIICLVLGIISISIIIMCYINFDQGLKEHIKLNNSISYINDESFYTLNSDKYSNTDFNVKKSIKTENSRASIQYDVLNIEEFNQNPKIQPSVESNSRQKNLNKEQMNDISRENIDQMYNDQSQSELLNNSFYNYSQIEINESKIEINDIDITEKKE